MYYLKKTTKNVKLTRMVIMLVLLISAFDIAWFYYQTNLKYYRIDNLSNNSTEKILRMIGIDNLNGEKAVAIETRMHSGDGYNLIEMKIDDIDSFVENNDVIETVINVNCNLWERNSKCYPKNCNYCALIIDDNKYYIAVKNHRPEHGTELMDYFFELYNNL